MRKLNWKHDNKSLKDEIDYRFRDFEHHILVSAIFFFSITVVFSLIKYSFAHLRFHPPTEPVFMIIGIIIGGVCHYVPSLSHCTDVIYGNLPDWNMIILPIMYYKVCLFTDFHRNTKMVGQVLCFGVLGVMISATLIGVTLKILEGKEISIKLGLMFGLFCVPIYPTTTTNKLRGVGLSFSQVSGLLEGESLAGMVTTFFFLRGLVGLPDHSTQEMIIHFTINLVAGTGVGWTLGKILCKLMGKFSDLPTIMMVTFFAPFSIYVFVHFLGFNEDLAFIIQVLLICKNRKSLRKEADEFLRTFICMMFNTITDYVLVCIGIFLAEEFCTDKAFTNMSYVACLYIIVICGRFFSYAVLSSFLNKFKCGLSLPQMGLAIWCGVPSLINILTMLPFYDHGYMEFRDVGKEMAGNLGGLVILGYMINVWTTPHILECLGLSYLSLARDVNMNVCFREIMNTRKRSTLVLKLDRLLCDAHWMIIKEGTILVHPYCNISRNLNDEEQSFRFAVCNHCNLEFSVPPTYREYQEMSREARKRVLKARKNFYTNQYEKGMLSEESYRVLIEATEKGMEMPDVHFEIEEILKIFLSVSTMECASTKLFNGFEYAFSVEHSDQFSSYKKKWVDVVVHPAFDLFMNMDVLCIVIPNIYFLVILDWEQYLPDFLGFVGVFCGVLIFEIVVKMYVLTAGRKCNGVVNYFRSTWNTLDFIFLSLILFELVCVFFDTYNRIILAISSLAAFRILRFFRVFRRFKYCSFVTYFTRRHENSVATRAYEIGKTFIKGEQELMVLIPGMVKDPSISEDILYRMDLDIMEIIRELEKIQKNRPRVAINVKTKQAIRYVLNSMSEEIDHIKVAGWVDEIEYKLIMRSIYERYQFLNKIKRVQWNSPRTLFEEITWLNENAWLTEYLYVSVHTKNFASNEYVIASGELATGVYIVLSGLLRIEYEPSRLVLEQLKVYGALPVMDYITDPNFNEAKKDYIVSGNSFGELSMLTGRPYACSVVTDSPCRLFFISGEDIRNAMGLDNDPVEGLECRMWRTICNGLALNLLLKAAPYRTTPSDEVRMCLDRSFLPNLRSFITLDKTEYIEDILLIEGIVLDPRTHVYYFAPRHIPRTVQNMALPGNSQFTLDTSIETKLMIITTPNAKPQMILDQQHVLNKENKDSHSMMVEKLKNQRQTLIALARRNAIDTIQE